MFSAIISEYDRNWYDYNTAWLNRLAQRYAYHCTIGELALQGFTLAEERQQDGSLHLTLRRA